MAPCSYSLTYFLYGIPTYLLLTGIYASLIKHYGHHPKFKVREIFPLGFFACIAFSAPLFILDSVLRCGDLGEDTNVYGSFHYFLRSVFIENQQSYIFFCLYTFLPLMTVMLIARVTYKEEPAP
jgi:hypothetical protein